MPRFIPPTKHEVVVLLLVAILLVLLAVMALTALQLWY